ncbi:MAG: SPOR domain-containing protein [Bacteroidales bacterium]
MIKSSLNIRAVTFLFFLMMLCSSSATCNSLSINASANVETGVTVKDINSCVICHNALKERRENAMSAGFDAVENGEREGGIGQIGMLKYESRKSWQDTFVNNNIHVLAQTSNKKDVVSPKAAQHKSQYPGYASYTTIAKSKNGWVRPVERSTTAQSSKSGITNSKQSSSQGGSQYKSQYPGYASYTTIAKSKNGWVRPVERSTMAQSSKSGITNSKQSSSQGGSQYKSQYPGYASYAPVVEAKAREHNRVIVEKKMPRRVESAGSGIKEIPTITDKGYYVVVASFRSIAEAQRYGQRLYEQKFTPFIIANDKERRYRLCTNKYATEQDASHMARMISQLYSEYSDAWVLKNL